jgi:hypothetical protein
MTPDVTRLTVEKVILHHLPTIRSDSDVKSIIFSELPCLMDHTANQLLTDRIREMLQAADPLVITVDPEVNSPVPKAVISLLHDSTDMVTVSQDLALHLFKSQRLRSPETVFIILQGSFENRKCLILGKQDLNQGVQLHHTVLDEGRSFHLIPVDDLLFTDHLKSFKLGLFLSPAEDDHNLQGLLFDHQSTLTRKPAAKYFLCDFLGCKLQSNNSVNTKNFYLSTQQFLSQNIDNSSKVFAISKALFQQLSSPDYSIDPIDFSRNHLPEELQDKFTAFMEERKVPLVPFTKDISLLEKDMNLIRLSLESGLQIRGDLQSILDSMVVSTTESGQVKIEIIDKIKHFGTNRGKLPV